MWNETTEIYYRQIARAQTRKSGNVWKTGYKQQEVAMNKMVISRSFFKNIQLPNISVYRHRNKKSIQLCEQASGRPVPKRGQGQNILGKR
jgi:hypothetical protein